MFTLRFFKTPYADGAENSSVVSGGSYQKYKRPNGSYELVVFDSAIQTEGVAYQVSNDERDFQHCYVENQSGKTIDHIYHVFATPAPTIQVPK